jgi:hypothetical protein
MINERMDHFVEKESARETEVVGENLPQCHLMYLKSHTN